MATAAMSDRVEVAPEDLDRILGYYERGLYLRAYDESRAFGPLGSWTGTAARVMAGRLASHLGAHRLSQRLHLRAWREDRADPEACYYAGRAILERKGPLAAWGFLRARGELPGAPAGSRADWFGAHAFVLAYLRDFDAAADWLARADRLAPDRPWLAVERAHVLEHEDRNEEALEAARRALELKPWYRPGVQAVAHVLVQLGRDGEAIDLLTEAAGRLESGPIAAQLAVLQSELGRHADARRSFERFAELSPLIEKPIGQWLAARRCDEAYYLGELAEAAEYARQVEGPFYAGLAGRLATPEPGGKRVLLDVPFVRQHHQTCAPATLAALGRFWGMPAEHLEVAGAICYDGTPDHRERHWAEQNGWVAREFAVTREAAVALLDRGVPFTLTTVEPTSAHLQGAIGYDTRRDTLLIREPSLRHWGEFLIDPLLERHRATGPRGMAMVPAARADLLDGIDLPDAPLYDVLHVMQIALHEHDRDRADAALAVMNARAPEHRLTLQARRLMAIYDMDRAEHLACVDRLLGLFPDDAPLQLAKLAGLRDFARRDERVAMLRAICDRPEADPVFFRLYAQELVADAREHEAAARLLRRAIRRRPLDDGNFATLANLLWDRRRFAEALELYRFASCLDDKDEGLARSYFLAARHLKQAEATLERLDRRFRRFGARSSQPARTLYWAYSLYERMTEAFAVLDEALRLRPDDGELLLFAADAHGAHGAFDRAAELLAAAEGNCRRAAWLRTSATLASMRGDLPGALATWRAVVEAEPLALDAHRAIAQGLAEAGDREAAVAHLRAACGRFPHNLALRQLEVEWLREEGPAVVEGAVRDLLAAHPADSWAHRELALALADLGRHDEAAAEMEVARGLEPHCGAYFTVLARVHAQAGRTEEAKEAYREAIRLSVDNDLAIARLHELCETRAERREALEFVREELIRQVIFGDGLLAYQQYAQQVFEPEELEALLRRALEARPDLWHAWSALIRQLVQMGRGEEALATAREATARFPLLPRLWYDLALVGEARRDREGEIEALRRALQISPGWGTAIRRLSQAFECEGQFRESKEVLLKAVAHAPLDALSWGFLADARWQLGEKEEAVADVRRALLLDPGYEWAWNVLRSWTEGLGRPDAAVELARELTARRPGESRTWMTLAQNLTRPEDRDERLAALDRTIALAPRLAEAHDLKAEALAEEGRYDEALAACYTLNLGGRIPLILRGRAAWVVARRGDLAKAADLMRAAVADEPDYRWGWRNLVDWYRDLEDAPNYLWAAEGLLASAPRSATALAMRGEARLWSRDRAGAKEDFRAAMELAPEYDFPALMLFDEQLTDGELEEAAATLAALRAQGGGEYVEARAVQLAARRGERAAALEGLRKLCAAPSRANWPIEAATTAAVEAGWAAEVEATLRAALEAGEVHEAAGELWVARRAARRAWRGCDRAIAGLMGRGEVGRRALVAFIKAVGKGNAPHKAERRRALRRCARRFGGLLRGETACWSQMIYALTGLADYRGAARWGADWHDRADAEPWMLLNLAFALRALGRHASARAVSLHATTLAPDYTSPFHAAWLTVDEALAGATEQAWGRLEGLNPIKLDEVHRFLRAVARALLLVQRAPAGPERRAAFADARGLMDTAASNHTPIGDDRPVIRPIYRRAVLRLAADCGGRDARAWAVRRWLAPRLPAAKAGG